MKRWLAGFGVTHDVVLDAIDVAMRPQRLMGVPIIFYYYGLCSIFSLAGRKIPVTALLSALGGHQKRNYFWGTPNPRNKRAAEQRLMMLAFLLEWTK